MIRGLTSLALLDGFRRGRPLQKPEACGLCKRMAEFGKYSPSILRHLPVTYTCELISTVVSVRWQVSNKITSNLKEDSWDFLLRKAQLDYHTTAGYVGLRILNLEML